MTSTVGSDTQHVYSYYLLEFGTVHCDLVNISIKKIITAGCHLVMDVVKPGTRLGWARTETMQ